MDPSSNGGWRFQKSTLTDWLCFAILLQIWRNPSDIYGFLLPYTIGILFTRLSIFENARKSVGTDEDLIICTKPVPDKSSMGMWWASWPGLCGVGSWAALYWWGVQRTGTRIITWFVILSPGQPKDTYSSCLKWWGMECCEHLKGRRNPPLKLSHEVVGYGVCCTFSNKACSVGTLFLVPTFDEEQNKLVRNFGYDFSLDFWQTYKI